MAYEGMEVSNHTIRCCNDALANDEIQAVHLAEKEHNQQPEILDFVRYEKKTGENNIYE